MAKQRYAVTYSKEDHDDYISEYFTTASEAEAYASYLVRNGKTFHGAASVELQEAKPYDAKNPLLIMWDTINIREVSHEGISPIL